MAFPLDARYQTFAPLQQVPSAYLNSQQDATLTTYRGATAVVGANGMTVERGDWVCDGVNDQVEIQAAIAWVAAQGGGTVMLTAGTFTLSAGIALDDRVQLVGAGAGTILQVSAAAAADFAVVLIDGQTNAAVLNMSIDGNIVGGHGHFHNGAQVTGASSGTVIERLYLRNFAMSGASLFGHGVEIVGTAERTRVVNCTTYDCRNSGIKAGSTVASQLTLIQGNIVRAGGSGGAGISVYGGANVQVLGNTLNGLELNVSTSIDPAPPSDVLVSGNLINGYGIFMRGSGIQAIGNHIKNASASGIWADRADFSMISNNTIYRSGVYGIWLDDCDFTACDNNIVVDASHDADNASSGIYIDAGTKCSVRGNIFHLTDLVTPLRTKACIEGAVGGTGAVNVSGNDCRAGSATAEIIDGAGDMVTTPYYTWDGAAHNVNDVQQANRIS